MATNRGAYDPRQFLHYPDKDPFSDAAQRRLDELIKDFLNTGIAFANGAGVRSIDTEGRRERVDLSNVDSDDTTHQGQAVGDATVNISELEEDEDFEPEFSKVDKGKGRDEREGPGLKGLWNNTGRFSPDLSPSSPSVNDATSFLSGSGSQGLEGSDGEPEDRDGFFEEAYENEGLDGEADDAEVENDPENTEFVSGHSGSPSSAQEIIYIGDSDEEDEPREAMSDIEADNGIEDNREWMRADVHDGDSEKGLNWGSGSEFGENERLELAGAWSYSLQGQGVDDNPQEPEWHQSQGKESDDDEGDYVAIDVGLDGDRGDKDSDRRSAIDQPRRFFASTSLVDPWVGFSNTTTKASSPVLAPAAWGDQSFQERNDDQMGGRSDVVGTEEISSFESVRDDVRPKVIDNTEGHESGPPPKLQSPDHFESLTSFIPDSAGLTGMAYLHPISEPDNVLSEQGVRNLGPAGFSSSDGGEAISVPHIDPATETEDPGELDNAGRAFLSSLTSAELQLDGGINVLGSLDASQTVSATSKAVDHHAHDATTVNLEPTPASIHLQESLGESTIKEAASELYPDHPVIALSPEPSTSQRNERNSDGCGGGPPDLLERTQVSEERHSPSSAHLIDKTMEPTPLDPPATSPADRFPLEPIESLGQNSSVGDKDSNDGSSSKPALLHQTVFDGQDLIKLTSAYTEAQCQNPLSAFQGECATSDIEIHDLIDDTTCDELVVTTVVSEAEEEEPHTVHDVPDTLETLIVTSIVSESEEDPHNIHDVPKPLETEEFGGPHPGDVIFSEYIVCEPMSDASPTRTEPPLPTTLDGGAERYASEDFSMSRLAPAISVGSSTPPLSPTATVTNSSSAPDSSIATSDLSAVNQAPVSVVTSVGSPPPIHIPRVSTIHADIRQPPTHVGYGSDDEQHSSNGFSALPDPRLPPEPTHLDIPVGVVGRNLAGDKEERAESMKVEPPRSDSEGCSLIGESRNKYDGEETPLTQVVGEVHVQQDALELKSLEQQFTVDSDVSAGSADRVVTEETIQDKMEAEHKLESPDELIYPDLTSDRLSEEDGGKRVSQLPVDSGNTFATEGCKVSQSPPASPKASETSLNPLSDTFGNAATAAIPDTKAPSEDTRHVAKLNIETESFCQTQNGTDAEERSASPPFDGDGINAFDTVDSAAASSIFSGSESVSPAKSESKSRRKSIKSKGRIKVVDRGAVSPPPPPQSIIYAHSKRSPASLKRPRPFETFAEPSKHPRLSRSPTATKSGSISGDTASPGAFDDKSDVSSVSSSSSAVSQLLVRREKSSSLGASSQSPSIKSQQSPTGADHSFTISIRKYVPHNHNHPPTAPPSRHASVERTTRTHVKTVSPSPASRPPHSSSTHQTRASCTDHKISIPGPDGLLYFLVPRCSLMNPEVEKDDSIVDCGVATRDEVERAIGDLEAVHLNSTTLGVIRQLAGVQLMREGQIGYLPRLEECLRHQVKHGRPQIHVSSAQDLSHTTPTKTRPSHMTSFSPESTLSPVSNSDSPLSDLPTDEEVSPSKSSKVFEADDGVYEATSEGVNDLKSVIPPPPSTKLSRSPKVIGSRKRKLRPEDAAYKPEIEATESSSDGENTGGKKRIKRSSKRKIDGSTQADGNSENLGTPSPKKRKRKYTEQDNLDGSLVDGRPERRGKKARRNEVDDRHGEDNVATAI